MKRSGIWGGLLGAAAAGGVVLALGGSVSVAGTVGMIVLMAVWWVTEALPLGAVALVPVLIAPLLGILDSGAVAKAYADPNIFLFLGGFCLALALEKSGLHRRLALGVIRAVGAAPGALLGGFMIATFVISMWVSNTATALMMLPVALAVLKTAEAGAPQSSGPIRRWGVALLLGVAYAASIGGAATLVGSPPNLILASQLRILFPEHPELDFARYLSIAFPLCLVFLGIAWGFLMTVTAGRGLPKSIVSRGWLEREARSTGPWTPAERRVLTVFLLMAVGWIFRADLDLGFATIPGWGNWHGIGRIGDAGVAIAGALLLFILPDGAAKPGGRLMDIDWVSRIPWDVLLLFGGGFAIAECVRASGFAGLAADAALSLKGLPLPALTLFLSVASTFLSEVMSNTAQCSILMPIIGSASASLGHEPLALMLPVAFASSLAFMLPAGTPPNAVVFASGRIKMRDMVLAGLGLNLIGSIWITAYLHFRIS